MRVRASSLEPVERTVPGTPPPRPSSSWPDASCPTVPSTLPACTAGRPARLRLGPPADGSADRLLPGDPGTSDHQGDIWPVAGHRGARKRDPVARRDSGPGRGGAVAQGTTVFSDVGELRVKEVDRLLAVAAMVEAFGARATIAGDTLAITGLGGPFRGGRFDSQGDHRMAMAAAVAALAARPGSAASSPDSMQSRPATRRSPRTWRGSSRAPGPRPLVVAIEGRLERANRPFRRRWRSGSASIGSIPAQCTGPSPRSPSNGDAPGDTDAVAALAAASIIDVGERVTIDGLDVTGLIRSPDVGQAVSSSPPIRRSDSTWWSASGPGPCPRWRCRRGPGHRIGRLPRAEVKVYLTASAQERARRRNDEAPEGVARRDRIDSTRDASPLREAEDAHRLDTTGRTVEDVVEEVLSWL